jgi:transcriptional regulator with XRE-family HTH domain
VTVVKNPPRTLLGAVIRSQRELAELSMRQLSARVGISNPYLSQIERGLRTPSEQVLAAIAESLATSADALYEAAGYSAPAGELPAAIEGARELTAAQRRALSELYRSFVAANELTKRAR